MVLMVMAEVVIAMGGKQTLFLPCADLSHFRRFLAWSLRSIRALSDWGWGVGVGVSACVHEWSVSG